MASFRRTRDCPGECDLFKTRSTRVRLEKTLRVRLGKRGGTMCDSVTAALKSMHAMPDDLFVYGILGQGEYGTVLGACDKLTSVGSEKVAIKVTEDSVHTRREIEMQERFHAIGLAPRVHHVTHVNGNTFIAMDHIDMTLESYMTDPGRTVRVAEAETIFQEIGDAIGKMYDNDLSHGDMHVGNIAVNVDDSGAYRSISFIDFGFSSGKDDSSIVTKPLQVLREYLQLLRTTSFLGPLEAEAKRIITRRLNEPDVAEILSVFQVGDDLENNHETQDQTFTLVHEFFQEWAATTTTTAPNPPSLL